MKYAVVNVEDKNADWKVVTIEMGENSFIEGVSVNRKDKKGGPDFPNFDQIINDSSIEGELWQSPTNQRWYLFAPRPKAATGGQGGSMRGVAAAQTRKREDIAAAQENKSHAIKVAAAMRDSVLLLNSLGYKYEIIEEMWEILKMIRNRYLKEWDLTEKSLDVPFKDGESAGGPRI